MVKGKIIKIGAFLLAGVLTCGILVGCNRHEHHLQYRADDWEKWETMPAEMLRQFPDYKKLEREGIVGLRSQIPCCEKSFWGDYDEWGYCTLSFDLPSLENDYKNRGIADEQYQAWTEYQSLFTFDGEDLSEGMKVTKTKDSYPDMRESCYSMQFTVRRIKEEQKSSKSGQSRALGLGDFSTWVETYHKSDRPSRDYWSNLGTDTFDVDGVSVNQTVYVSRHVPFDAMDKQHVVFCGALNYRLAECSVSIMYAAYDCVISTYPPEQKPILDSDLPLPHRWNEEELDILYQRIRNRVKEVSTYTLQRIWNERTI